MKKFLAFISLLSTALLLTMTAGLFLTTASYAADKVVEKTGDPVKLMGLRDGTPVNQDNPPPLRTKSATMRYRIGILYSNHP
jgi:hypothetical protein